MSLQSDPTPSPFDTAPAAVDADGVPIVVQPAVAAPVAAVRPAVPVVEQPVVQPMVQPVVQTAAVHQTVATSYGRHYAFDSVVVGLVGLAFLLIGLIAMTRAGFDGSMRDPVVDVLGFTHTTTLGIIEAAIGLCLLLCAATMTRGGSVFFGLVLGVAGVVGAVQTDSFRNSLALESGLAWLAVVASILVVLVSLLVPRMVTRTDRVEAV